MSARDETARLRLLCLLVATLLASALTKLTLTLFAIEDQERQQEEEQWLLEWGEQFDPALPTWAYSELKRERWGLSLSAAPESQQAGAKARQGLAQAKWTPLREKLAFSKPASTGEPHSGIRATERCQDCHRFGEISTLPDPELLLADSIRPGDAIALASASSHSANSNSLRGRQAHTREDKGGGITTSASHPGAWLIWHDPKRFDCTTCHGGVAGESTLAGSGHRGHIPPPWSSKSNPHKSPITLINSTAQLWASCGKCHPGDYVPANPLLSEGRQLIRWLNCAGCHATGPNLASQPPAKTRGGKVLEERTGLPGPPLGNVASRLKPAILQAYANEAHSNSQGGRMPEYALPQVDLDALGAYLSTLRSHDAYMDGGAQSIARPAPGDPARGAKLAEQAKCLGCHAGPASVSASPALPLQGSTAVSGRPGPSLVRADARLLSGAVERILRDSRAEFLGTRMPQFTFDTQDRADITAWLLQGSAPGNRAAATGDSASREAPDSLLLKRGKELAHLQGCTACHLLPGAQPQPDPPRLGPSLVNIGSKPMESLPIEAQRGGNCFSPDLYAYFKRQLQTPEAFTSTPAAMPHFSLSAKQRAAVAIALLAEQEAVMPELMCRSAATVKVESHWPNPIPAQGAGSEWLSPLERSLDAQACAQCHPQQYKDWSTSRHALAMGPGVSGQIVEWVREKPGEYLACLRCHTRLSEQALVAATPSKSKKAMPLNAGNPCAAGSRLDSNAAFIQSAHNSPGLSSQAHGCANCHLRAHERVGSDKPRQKYPWKVNLLSAHELRRDAILRQSEMCKDCHQFDAAQGTSNGGPPLQNTYQEWASWAASAGQAKSCQDCHMPEGGHSFLGIHNRDFVAANAMVRHEFKVTGKELRAKLTLVNQNNGHHLPTYVTPRIWLRAWLADVDGNQIAGSKQELVIGRESVAEKAEGKTVWRDVFDSRIPAGESATLHFSTPLNILAASLHLEVFCAPDHFYHDAYSKWLKDSNRSQLSILLLKDALEDTDPMRSGYFIFQKDFSLEASD